MIVNSNPAARVLLVEDDDGNAADYLLWLADGKHKVVRAKAASDATPTAPPALPLAQERVDRLLRQLFGIFNPHRCGSLEGDEHRRRDEAVGAAARRLGVLVEVVVTPAAVEKGVAPQHVGVVFGKRFEFSLQ